MVEVVNERVQELKADGTFIENNLSVPQIIVLTPDTQVVVDVVKDLKAKFSE